MSPNNTPLRQTARDRVLRSMATRMAHLYPRVAGDRDALNEWVAQPTEAERTGIRKLWTFIDAGRNRNRYRAKPPRTVANMANFAGENDHV